MSLFRDISINVLANIIAIPVVAAIAIAAKMSYSRLRRLPDLLARLVHAVGGMISRPAVQRPGTGGWVLPDLFVTLFRSRSRPSVFEGLGWFVCGVVVAPACYMVTSAGAAERQRLHVIEHKVAEKRRQVRSAEDEFLTRANLRQVQKWNDEFLRLEPWNVANLCADILCVEARMLAIAEAERNVMSAKARSHGKSERHPAHETPRGS